ncbi:MAG: hypothetical protein ACK480_17315 [Planctomycetota bacterium]
MTGLRKSSWSLLIIPALMPCFTGCQTNSMMSMPWNQPSRVPPPNAPSNLPSAPYANPTIPASAPAQPGFPAPKSVSSYSNGPLTDAVTALQNDLTLVTENTRATVEKSANSISDGVSQAGARLDRIGSGIVQATGIVESSFKDPILMPPATSGSLSDATQEDPNAQLRKPNPR